MSAKDVTILVCVTCRQGADADLRPGAVFLDALGKRLTERGETGIKTEAVECLAVCKRPSTVALAGEGRWTYVIGDLDSDKHIDDIIDSARSFGATANGIVAWKERPACFRAGVISRTPPLKA